MLAPYGQYDDHEIYATDRYVRADRPNGSLPPVWTKFQFSGVVIVDCAAEEPRHRFPCRPFAGLLLCGHSEGDLVLGGVLSLLLQFGQHRTSDLRCIPGSLGPTHHVWLPQSCRLVI